MLIHTRFMIFQLQCAPPVILDEFYISCIWNFHSYSMSSQGFDIICIPSETRRNLIVEVRILDTD